MERKIETERLILRAARIEDADILYETRQSEFVLQYNAMIKRSREEMLEMVKKDSLNKNTWYIEYKENRQAIGAIYLHEDSLRWETNTMETSYWLAEEYGGKGIMQEALRAVIDMAFETLQLSGITARCFAPNVASRKLLEKLGFVQEGYLKNAVKGYQDRVFDDVLYYLEGK